MIVNMGSFSEVNRHIICSCSNKGVAEMNVAGERRKRKRLPIRLALRYSHAHRDDDEHKGRTVNVSSSGLLIEARDGEFVPGSLVNIELEVPPNQGLLDFGGRLTGLARVIRVDMHLERDQPSSNSERIALEFCQRPQLYM